LIGNAIKFTETGEVRVHLERCTADHWTIEVSDTGPGIPEEARQYIYDPFRQVDGSITRGHRGTGLGLAIVKDLVELMGGSVNLASEVGQGSTFTVMLPISPNSEFT
jgi:signal transduction histidine kinase